MQKDKELIDEGSRSQRFTLLMLVVMAIITQATNGLFAGLEREQSRGVALLGYAMLFGLMAYWLEKDSRRHKIAWVYDRGFFFFWHGQYSCLSICLRPVA